MSITPDPKPARYAITHQGVRLEIFARPVWRAGIPELSWQTQQPDEPAWPLRNQVNLVKALRLVGDEALIRVSKETSPIVRAIIDGAIHALEADRCRRSGVEIEDGDAA